jgi:hypothetical protein
MSASLAFTNAVVWTLAAERLKSSSILFLTRILAGYSMRGVVVKIKARADASVSRGNYLGVSQARHRSTVGDTDSVAVQLETGPLSSSGQAIHMQTSDTPFIYGSQ